MFKELFTESKQIKNTIKKEPNSAGSITRNITWKDNKFSIGAYDEAVLSVNNKGQVEAYSNKGSTKELAENVSNALKEKTPEMKQLKKILLKISGTILCRTNYKDTIEVDIKTGKIMFKELFEAKPTAVDTFKKLKDFDVKALKGYARKVGVPAEAIRSLNNKEATLEEILSYLYDDNWMDDLMKAGVL